ncbi:MAG: hypothetical protein IPF82_16305 [Blastocatellia bacterium]|nr:hypothetical protein [Blastocatellia bacterium]
MGWFLATVLTRFAGVCDARGKAERAIRYRDHAADLARAVEEHAWDGEWYLRACFDDGTPLGTAMASECRIDSIAQSWSVISGFGSQDRQRRVMPQWRRTWFTAATG